MKTRELLIGADRMEIPESFKKGKSRETLAEMGYIENGKASDSMKKITALVTLKLEDLEYLMVSSIRHVLESGMTTIENARLSLEGVSSSNCATEIFSETLKVLTGAFFDENKRPLKKEMDEIESDISKLLELRDEEEAASDTDTCSNCEYEIASDWSLWIKPVTETSPFIDALLEGFIAKIKFLNSGATDHGGNEPPAASEEDVSKENPAVVPEGGEGPPQYNQPGKDETEGSEVGSSETEEGQDPSQDQSGQDVEETTKRRVYSPIE